jgi:hypothetical protein
MWDKRDRIPGDRQGWYLKVVDYGRDKIDAKELIRRAGKSKWSQCEANFFIGQRLVGDGKRDEAREKFEAAAATRVFLYGDYWWSRAFLARMKADPKWPGWIEPKK